MNGIANRQHNGLKQCIVQILIDHAGYKCDCKQCGNDDCLPFIFAVLYQLQSPLFCLILSQFEGKIYIPLDRRFSKIKILSPFVLQIP